MSELLKSRRINSPFGIFLQLPVLFVTAFGLYKLLEMLYYSLCDCNMLQKPSFVGFANYSKALVDEVIQKSLGNTAFMVFIVAILLLLTAVAPAVFTARLKLPFGLGIMAAFSVISVCAMLSNCFKTFFSSDSYGILNSLLLSARIIDDPIAFTQTHARLLAVIILWLYCLAPVFSFTYIAAKMKHSFLGVAISVSAIPVLMFSGGGAVASVIGYPSYNYSADWIYTVFNDYLTTRFNAGLAYSILVIGFIMLIGYCLAVCGITFGIRALCKKVNSNSTAFKVIGFITFLLSILLAITLLAFVILYLLKAFMPFDELFLVPHFTPLRPTIKNFSDLFKMMSNSFVPYSKYLINSLINVPKMIIPICLFVALPSGVGFGLFNMFKRQKLLLLCFIPFILVSGYITLSKLGVINTYYVYIFDFISSLEFFIAVFLGYLAVKLVFYENKPKIKTILLGSFFVLSAFIAIGVIRGVWYTSNGAIYDENLKILKDVSYIFASGGIARCGVAAANDILMLALTLAAVIVPVVLLLMLYFSYRKNSSLN